MARSPYDDQWMQEEEQRVRELEGRAGQLQEHYNSLSPEERAAADEEREGKAGKLHELDGGDLDDLENLAGDHHEDSPMDRMTQGFSKDPKTGLFKPDGSKMSAKSKAIGGASSSLKKKVAIAGAAAGGMGLFSILIFLILLPFKIDFILSNLQLRFEEKVASSVAQESSYMFSRYVADSILPSLTAGRCHTTIDPKCVVVPGGTGPFKKAWTAYVTGRVELKLAQDPHHPIIFSREGGTYYMNLGGLGPDGKKIDMTKSIAAIRRGEMTIFDLPGTKAVSAAALRTELRKSIKSGTVWDKAYKRFKVPKLAESKYGMKFCIFWCKPLEKKADSLAARTLAAKAVLFQRMLPEKYAYIMSCVIGGVTGTCDPNFKDADPPKPGDTERLSKFQIAFQERMAELASHFTEHELEEMVEKAKTISQDGLKKTVAREAVKALVSSVGGDAAGQAAGEAAEKLVGPVAWFFLFAEIISDASKIGPFLDMAAYQGAASTAVQVYETYNAFNSECMSGHCDNAEGGSMNLALATSLSGDPSKAADATASRVFKAFVDPTPSGATASIFGSLLGGSAFAGTLPDTSVEHCDDGSLVPAGKLVCPEMNFREDGNHVADGLAGAVNSIPGLVPTANAVSVVGKAPSDLVASVLEKIPAFNTLSTWIGNEAAAPLAKVESAVITTPDVDSGARQLEMMAAGADIIGNQSCKQLGCPKNTDQQAAAIQNQQIAEQKADFADMPFFARVFSLDTSYSLLGHLALTMPSSFVGLTTSGLGSLLTNPLSRLSSMLSSVFSTNLAFADAATTPDPFGITQYGYTNLPSDPEGFWNQNCVQGPLATYDEGTGVLDVSKWLLGQQQDMQTGESIQDVANPCLLIQTSLQITAGVFDPTQLPQGAANPD